MKRRNSRIRVAIAGVGNCASSLVQGVRFYAPTGTVVNRPGLANLEIGGYRAGDIAFSAAFDVAESKVHKDLAQAIFQPPNNTFCFQKVPKLRVRVQRGPTLDGLGAQLRSLVRESRHKSPVDVARVLRETQTHVLVSYLPVGAKRAAEFYADQALHAGCALVNCVPVFIASSDRWRRKFERARLPLIGDDIKSQLGATITHRMLANLFRERGVRVERTYQLNFGGNSDFLNMLDRSRLTSKKISKTRAVESQIEHGISPRDIHVAPSDYVPWLEDRKVCFIRMEGSGFGGMPVNLELKLEVWDSPNSAGIVIDAIRCAKLALDRGVGGALVGPCGYFMKSPPTQMTDAAAREALLAFVKIPQPDIAP